MSIRIYLISRDDIEHKLRDFIDSYSDLNGHFLESEVNKGSLLTIYTDLEVNNLALELQIAVAKLHKIEQSSRRKSPIKLTLFAFDNWSWSKTGPKLVQTGAGPKLVQTGTGPKLVQTGPKAQSGRSMDDGSKNGPKPKVNQWTQTDSSADQNINVQMERLANLTFQSKFLGSYI